jgi:hypothetical protein
LVPADERLPPMDMAPYVRPWKAPWKAMIS